MKNEERVEKVKRRRKNGKEKMDGKRKTKKE